VTSELTESRAAPARQTLRLYNVNYALPRLLALVAAIAALAVLSWLAALNTDMHWYAKALLLGIPAAFVFWAGYHALRAAWRIDVDERSLRVRYLLSRREYPWPEVTAVRPMWLVTEWRASAPLFRHRAVEFTVAGGRKVIICVRRCDVAALAERVGPRWLSNEQMEEARAAWIRTVAITAVLILIWVLIRFLARFI
jgi:hypothetical protein